MRKKISFVVFSNSGAPAKQISTSKAFIHLLGFFCLAFIGAFGYIIYDYYTLKQTTSHLQNREHYLSNQLGEIQHQREQIQSFANEINMLKSKLVALSGFEKQIRIIANIEKIFEDSSVFSILAIMRICFSKPLKATSFDFNMLISLAKLCICSR